MKSPDCSFVLSVERGKLEAQAVLLVESLRRFGGAYADAAVYAVSPRPARRIGAACRAALERLGVHTVVEALAPPDEAYGTYARLAACAWAERTLSHEILVSLDDDLFFAADPDFRLTEADLFARPVDMKGMCTASPDDPFDHYWREIARACGVDYDRIPWLTTTVDRVRVKASYNGGMVAVRRRIGLFQTAERLFRLLRERDLSPRAVSDFDVFASTGFVGPEASRWWGSSQAVLSLAATLLDAVVEIAPPIYNIPAHLSKEWADAGGAVPLRNAVLVHYHWLFDEDRFEGDAVLLRDSELPAPVVDWLKTKTPLKEFPRSDCYDDCGDGAPVEP
ncbi:MAG: hypothetical protein ACRC1K_16560 [Planctomycetia bacterium]